MQFKNNKKKLVLFGFILLLLFAFATAGYFYYRYQQLKADPQLLAKEEVAVLVAQITKYMDLPEEEPSLATVSDKTKLQDQEFFKKAENGDKIIIYPKAKKAILFRPSTGRVIEFAPLTIAGNGQTTQAPASKPATVAIYNGSSVAGLTGDIEKMVLEVEGVTVVSKENAKKKSYTKTQVIDLRGTNAEITSVLAKKVSGEVAALPKEEQPPEADVLIIVARPENE